MLNERELERLRTAAADACWLCTRGYPAQAVAHFIAQHRDLTPRERALLAAVARAEANHRHHIARELDEEDLEGRVMRLDVASICSTLASALAAASDSSIVFFESTAGLVGAPEVPDDARAPNESEALRRIAERLLQLRLSAVRIVHDAAASEQAATLCKLLKASRKPAVTSEEVPSIAARMKAATFVASTAPEVLDGCGTWFNLAASLVRASGIKPLKFG